jgi:hypothetical protein
MVEIMRHCYVGDVGDFGKFGLLRALMQKRKTTQLGVIWYLTNTLEQNNDGRHDGYLKRGPRSYRELFRSCDPALYDALAKIRSRRRLNVSLIERRGILPDNTCFVRTAVPSASAKKPHVTRGAHPRQLWFRDASKKVSSANIVFVDPDNGVIFSRDGNIIEPAFSHKHAYSHELDFLLERGQSVIAYHHLGRQRGGHMLHVRKTVQVLSERGYEAVAVHYRRGSGRAFFVIPACKRDRRWLFESASRFSVIWSSHCQLIQ